MSTVKKVARRGFLGTLGAGGLTAASAVFGKSASAYGVCHRECCTLEVCPNITMATCRANAYYVWSCVVSPRRGCSCCESKFGGFQRSAYSCTTCYGPSC